MITRESPGGIDDTVSRVYAWGVRKKQFTVKQIELAADVLRTKDWIDPGALRSRS